MKVTRTNALLGTLATTLFAVAALAADPADFSGTWVLNTDKGENLGMVAALQETVTIEQADDSLTMNHKTTFRGDDSFRTVTYDLGGGELPNEGPMGEKAMTTARWDGDRLVAEWTMEGAVAGTTVTRTETRWLAEDGQEMHVKSARGERPPMVMVYERAR